MKQLYPLRKHLFCLSLLFCFKNGFSQNVGINSSGSAPAASAGLDVSFTDKGLLMPRVALTGTTDVTTIASPATSLLVYNTATASDVTPGFYYYDGSAWVKLNTQFVNSGSDISYSDGSVNIGTATSDASALLNVSSSSKGVLIPQVALSSTTVSSPVTSPTTSLLVYNTATAGTTPNDVTPGYYYWTGSAWTRLANGNTTVTGWGTSGNSGTTTSNFIGTTDAQDLIFKTNGVEHMRIDAANGNFGIGATPVAESKLSIDGGTIATTDGLGTVVSVYAERNQFIEFNIQNGSNGNSASSDVVATADNGTETSNYVDMGINSSSYSNQKSNYLNKANVAYLYSNSAANFKIGNGGLGQALCFFTNPSSGTLGTLTANGFERMRIDGDGNVGIGEFWNRSTNGNELTVPYKLTVDGIAAPRSDNSYTLGTSSNRWSTVYAANGTIQTSDRRLKTNISPLKYGLKQVISLEPVSYNWKTEPTGNTKLGLIAQDLRKVVPEVVVGDEAKENLGVNYADLVPVLINAIKEQQALIDKQQKQISEQQKQFDELKKIVESLAKK